MPVFSGPKIKVGRKDPGVSDAANRLNRLFAEEKPSLPIILLSKVGQAKEHASIGGLSPFIVLNSNFALLHCPILLVYLQFLST